MDFVVNLHLFKLWKTILAFRYPTPEVTEPYVNDCGFNSNIVLVCPYSMVTFNVL